MTSNIHIVTQKNQWLCRHVDVPYPTPESLKGRDLYLQRESSLRYLSTRVLPSGADNPETTVDEICLVDFHRLTVLYAQLFSSLWADEHSQSYVLEFLAQIQLNEEVQLYLGIKAGRPVACGLALQQGNQLLISDLACCGVDNFNQTDFICQIASYHVSEGRELEYVIPDDESTENTSA